MSSLLARQSASAATSSSLLQPSIVVCARHDAVGQLIFCEVRELVAGPRPCTDPDRGVYLRGIRRGDTLSPSEQL